MSKGAASSKAFPEVSAISVAIAAATATVASVAVAAASIAVASIAFASVTTKATRAAHRTAATEASTTAAAESLAARKNVMNLTFTRYTVITCPLPRTIVMIRMTTLKIEG